MENDPSLIELGPLLHRLDKVSIVLVSSLTLRSAKLFPHFVRQMVYRPTMYVILGSNTSISSATNTGHGKASYRTLDYRTIPVGEALGAIPVPSSDTI